MDAYGAETFYLENIDMMTDTNISDKNDGKSLFTICIPNYKASLEVDSL